MAGKTCPNCGELTFFSTTTGRECTKCGFKMVYPANEGKGGKGRKCPNCGRFTVFDGKCEVLPMSRTFI